MKKSPFIMMMIASVAAISCKKDQQPVSAAADTSQTQKVAVASDAWKVSYFADKGIDQTTDYSTYLFQFNSDGSAVANSTGIGILYYGSWSLVKGNHSSYDDSGNHIGGNENKLLITFSGNHHMDEISEDWKIIKLTDTEMWLKDDNAISAKTIRFIKN